MIRGGPSRDDLAAALRVLELRDPARVVLSTALDRAQVIVGSVREIELATLCELRQTQRAVEHARSRWKRVRAMPVASSLESLSAGPLAWEPSVIESRGLDEPVVVVCGACGGRRPTRCVACHGLGRASCACSRTARRTCAACRGTGRKHCTRCRGTGFLGCTRCEGAGELLRVDVHSIERSVDLRRLALDEHGAAVDATVLLPDDDEVARAFVLEHEEQADRLRADAARIDEGRAAGYRSLPTRGFDRAADAAARAMLDGYAPRPASASVVQQRLRVRSLQYACARWPASRYAVWVLGTGRLVVEQGTAPAPPRVGRWAAAASIGVSVSAALAWWFARG